MNINNIKLRQRFVDDFNLPVSVLDSPYFEYQLKLYDPHFESHQKWEWVLSLIKEQYDDNENLFLEDYYFCRNKIITSIEESNAYKEFISSKMMGYGYHNYHTTFSKIGKTSVYTKGNNGKYFLSIDLKHANFQGLKCYNHALVNYADNYEDFIKYHLGDNHPLITYFNNSKYTRQIIFGKLNMARNTTIQQDLMCEIWKTIEKYVEKNDKIKIHSKQVDELILEIDTNKGFLLERIYLKIEG